MKKSKYTEEPKSRSPLCSSRQNFAHRLKSVPQDRTSDATFYTWRKKFGGLGPSEARRLKKLEEENAKLKRPVADFSLDKAMFQDVLSEMPAAFSQTLAGRRSHDAPRGEPAPSPRRSAAFALGICLPLTGTIRITI